MAGTSLHHSTTFRYTQTVMAYKILMVGPQGSGKGTQAELLAKHLGIPAFSMGQLCRDAVAAETERGLKIDAILKAGNLVSDQDAAELLQERLAYPDAKDGYILDGYPRNAAQRAAFDFDTPTHVIVIEVPREESLKRLGGRLTCVKCGRVASVAAGANIGDVCVCGSTFAQRSDDTPEAINRRLDIYENDTQPVISQYDAQGLVRRVDGVGSVEEVQQRILDAIGK